MNDELQNKSNNIKVTYVRSNDNADKRTQKPSAGRGDISPGSYRLGSRQRTIYDGKNFRHNDHKSDGTLEIVDHGGISGKSFIVPKVLRRQRAEETRVYGEHACQALFQRRPDCIVRAWLIKGITPRFKEAMHWMATNRKAYHIVGDIELTKASGTEHHGGICFLIKKRNGITVRQWVSQADTNDCVLALENVGNPHNLGAIMRSCAHFGVKGILLKDAARLESGAALRTAEGGAEHIQPIDGNGDILNALEEFRKAGYTIITTSSHSGAPLFKTILPRRMVLVMGQERYGLSNTTLFSADLRVSINGTGNVESLNVSVAASVLLAEWRRQNKT